jgi:hypothetical protein
MAPAETATTDLDVTMNTAKLVAATPGATVDESRGEAGRTADEKVEAIDKAAAKTADVEQFKTMFELAGGSQDEMRACLQQVVYVLERCFNVDFVRDAPLTEVIAGIAHQRAAMSPWRESPQLVDDVVVPPGVNNAGDEVLPPNLLEGSDDAAKLGFTDGPTAEELEGMRHADLDEQYGDLEGYPKSGNLADKQEFVAQHGSATPATT